MFVHTHKRWLFSLLLVLLFSVTSRLTLAQGKQGYSVTIDPANFVSAIDNPYNPRLPGMRWVYEGQTASGLERDVIEILSKTRQTTRVPNAPHQYDPDSAQELNLASQIVDTGATVRKRARMPSTCSTPRAMCCAISVVPPFWL